MPGRAAASIAVVTAQPEKGGIVARKATNSNAAEAADRDDGIRSQPLEPIGVVERELTRPDGTKLRVEVPVYPPFKLEEHPATKPPARNRFKTAKRATTSKANEA